MKLLLIRPDRPETHLDDRNRSLQRLGDMHQPIGLLYLATMLARKNIPVRICDEQIAENHQEMISAFRPDLVGITVTSPLMPKVAAITAYAKEKGCKVVLGGPHISALPAESLRQTKADVAVCGEGEYTIVDLCEQKVWDTIAGIAYWKNNEVTLNKKREPIADLDGLPFLSRELVDVQKYKYDTELGFPLKPGELMFRILTSRGCPFCCSNCASHSIFGRKHRFRSPENIVAEIEEIKTKWHVRSFTFIDDDFTLNRQHLHNLCHLIIKKQLNIQWVCIAKVGLSYIDMSLMKEAGCQMIGFGIESGSPKILSAIKKELNLADALSTFHDARKAGLKTRAFFIVGLPGEEEADFQKSVQFAYKLKPTYLWASIFLPLPGSDLYQNLPPDKKNSINWNQQNSYFYSSEKILQQRHRTFLKRYYVRPGYFKTFFRHCSLRDLNYFWRMFLVYLYLSIKKKM